MDPFSLILLGVGSVGRHVIHRLEEFRVQHIVLRAILDSNGAIDFGMTPVSFGTERSPITISKLHKIMEHKANGHSLVTSEFADRNFKKEMYEHYIHHLVAQAPTRTIVVDCSASDCMTHVIVEVLKQGAGVVMANKKPLTNTQTMFENIANEHGKRVRYESTCGAGTPIVAVLQRLVKGKEMPIKIQGTFSGTLGFVVSEMQSGKTYSEAVVEATKRGYTEPDPRDDLGGTDVARKALILARTAGIKAEMEDVAIEPLYPKKFDVLTIQDFMKALPQLDAEYMEKQKAAKTENKVLRYVASIQDGKIEVGLRALDEQTPIGRLQGTENMAEFYTAIYTKPLVVQGFGAGAEVTALGVLTDIVELVEMMGPKC